MARACHDGEARGSGARRPGLATVDRPTTVLTWLKRPTVASALARPFAGASAMIIKSTFKADVRVVAGLPARIARGRPATRAPSLVIEV